MMSSLMTHDVIITFYCFSTKSTNPPIRSMCIALGFCAVTPRVEGRFAPCGSFGRPGLRLRVHARANCPRECTGPFGRPGLRLRVHARANCPRECTGLRLRVHARANCPRELPARMHWTPTPSPGKIYFSWTRSRSPVHSRGQFARAIRAGMDSESESGTFARAIRAGMDSESESRSTKRSGTFARAIRAGMDSESESRSTKRSAWSEATLHAWCDRAEP